MPPAKRRKKEPSRRALIGRIVLTKGGRPLLA
jgi:hypothetical protein